MYIRYYFYTQFTFMQIYKVDSSNAREQLKKSEYFYERKNLIFHSFFLYN